MRLFILSHIKSLIDPLKDDFNNKINKKDVIRCSLIATAIWITSIIVAVAIYKASSAITTYNEQWIQAIQTKCKGSFNLNTILLNNAFIKAGMASAIFGAYFGVIIDSSFL